MTLVPLPALADNYIWMASSRLQLAAILVTHHHADHTGGVAALPFLRSREATVSAATLREWKNDFR